MSECVRARVRARVCTYTRLSIGTGGVDVQLVTRTLPRNMNFAAIATSGSNDNTTITCYHHKAGNALVWKQQISANRMFNVRANSRKNAGGSIAKYFAIAENGVKEKLLIHQLTLSDAKKYVCEDSRNTSDIVSVELVLMSKYPGWDVMEQSRTRPIGHCSSYNILLLL